MGNRWVLLIGNNLGSTYRGRILCSFNKYGKTDPITKVYRLKFKFPKNPYPISPVKNYLLRIDILEGVELP